MPMYTFRGSSARNRWSKTKWDKKIKWQTKQIGKQQLIAFKRGKISASMLNSPARRALRREKEEKERMYRKSRPNSVLTSSSEVLGIVICGGKVRPIEFVGGRTGADHEVIQYSSPWHAEHRQSSGFCWRICG